VQNMFYCLLFFLYLSILLNMCKEYHYAYFCFDLIFSLLKSDMEEETGVTATEGAVGVGGRN